MQKLVHKSGDGRVVESASGQIDDYGAKGPTQRGVVELWTTEQCIQMLDALNS